MIAEAKTTINIADRISLLGTETAFAVSGEATAFAAKGNKVYPFHLGDLNLKTPSTIVSATIRAINDGKTGYCPPQGIEVLREALANDVNQARGTTYTIENVAIQPGGKPTIGKFILALMNPGDEVLYPNPGYPIYESQIAFNGGIPVPYTFKETSTEFCLDIEGIKEKITERTKMLVINSPQNPTGAEHSLKELEMLADLAIENNLLVLSDEAYFDIRYEGKSHSIASLPGMQDRTIILYTFSKKFAMSGWRLGATIGPSKIVGVVAKLNVNDESCSNHFIQYGALAGLTGDQSEIKAQLEILRNRRDAAHEILSSIAGIRCFLPSTTFYLFPNVTKLMERKGYHDYEDFRKDILYKTGVSFCTRMHFGKRHENEMEKYVRFAYSGINIDEIKEGLGKMRGYLA